MAYIKICDEYICASHMVSFSNFFNGNRAFALRLQQAENQVTISNSRHGNNTEVNSKNKKKKTFFISKKHNITT